MPFQIKYGAEVYVDVDTDWEREGVVSAVGRDSATVQFKNGGDWPMEETICKSRLMVK